MTTRAKKLPGYSSEIKGARKIGWREAMATRAKKLPGYSPR